jgi:hypothetical protein
MREHYIPEVYCQVPSFTVRCGALLYKNGGENIFCLLLLGPTSSLHRIKLDLFIEASCALKITSKVPRDEIKTDPSLP